MKILQLFRLFGIGVFSIFLMIAPTVLSAQITNTTHPINSPYATLQDAIDDPITVNGDGIFVAHGTYFGNVTLNKRLVIYGDQNGVPGCDRVGLESTLFVTSGPVLTLGIGSAGSELRGLTFSGGNKSIVSLDGPLDNILIKDCRFIGFTENAIFLTDPGLDITIDNNSIDGSGQMFSGHWFTLAPIILVALPFRTTAYSTGMRKDFL